eukprot:1138662-Pelagomonas_calceolata.AAC.4
MGNLGQHELRKGPATKSIITCIPTTPQACTTCPPYVRPFFAQVAFTLPCCAAPHQGASR